MVSTKDWFEVGRSLDTRWLVHGRTGGSDVLSTDGAVPDQAGGVERRSAGSSRDGVSALGICSKRRFAYREDPSFGGPPTDRERKQFVSNRRCFGASGYLACGSARSLPSFDIGWFARDTVYPIVSLFAPLTQSPSRVIERPERPTPGVHLCIPPTMCREVPPRKGCAAD